MRITRRSSLNLLGAAATGLVTTAFAPYAFCATPGDSSVLSGDATELFLELSSILTGEPRSALDAPLALEYMVRLDQQFPGELSSLLIAFQNALAEAAGDHAQLIALIERDIWRSGDCKMVDVGGSMLCDRQANPQCCLARDIPLLWYAGALMVRTDLEVPTAVFKQGSTASYLGALAWKVAEAHPQGQCGGTYGYWASLPGEPHPTEG